MARQPEHEAWMRRALALARRGLGRTSPNPPVGAVIVRRERAVGWGFHAGAGLEHAEVVALKRAGAGARKATLYVTLEPCCHQGKTPPCVDAIVEAGITRVVAAMPDPNPRVRGRGFKQLRRAGVDVVQGIMVEEARDLIEPFAFFIRTGLPFVTLKLAASADGRIATGSGESRWITGTMARRRARQLRAEVDAIMVGAGTVKKDDPCLTARISGKRDPLRVVVDGRITVKASAKVFGQGRGPGALLIAEERAAGRRGRTFRCRGVEVMPLPGKQGRIPMKLVMRRLAERGIVSVLVEGGGELAGEIVRAGLVRKLVVFIAPRLLGGDAIPMIGALGVERLCQSPRLHSVRSTWIGPDLLLEGYVSL